MTEEERTHITAHLTAVEFLVEVVLAKSWAHLDTNTATLEALKLVAISKKSYSRSPDPDPVAMDALVMSTAIVRKTCDKALERAAEIRAGRAE